MGGFSTIEIWPPDGFCYELLLEVCSDEDTFEGPTLSWEPAVCKGRPLAALSIIRLSAEASEERGLTWFEVLPPTVWLFVLSKELYLYYEMILPSFGWLKFENRWLYCDPRVVLVSCVYGCM